MSGTRAIWESFAHRLRGFLRKRVADANVVDDLLQETFLRIHRGLGTLRDEARLAAWVFQVARNVLHDHFGRRDRTDPVAVEVDEDAEVRREVASWLPEFVHGLPPSYRKPVISADLEGKPHAEIASELGLSLTAVKSRVRRGRALLRKMLLDCCHFELDRRKNVIGVEPCGDGGACGCRNPQELQRPGRYRTP